MDRYSQHGSTRRTPSTERAREAAERARQARRTAEDATLAAAERAKKLGRLSSDLRSNLEERFSWASWRHVMSDNRMRRSHRNAVYENTQHLMSPSQRRV